MKTRFLIALATIVASVFAAQAATVDEIIAQFPAQDAATANALFDQLLAMDDDAIEDLCTRLVPLGAGDDNAVRYALTGLARYVSRPGADERDDVEEAFLEGLKKNENPECRAFLLRQLQQCASDESVKSVARLLKDEANASHATLVLDTLGTEKANRALTKGLRTKSSATQLQILSALADNGANRTASRVIRKRIEAGPETNEYIHLLSILVSLEGKKAWDVLNAAIESEDTRISTASMNFAVELGLISYTICSG